MSMAVPESSEGVRRASTVSGGTDMTRPPHIIQIFSAKKNNMSRIAANAGSLCVTTIR